MSVFENQLVKRIFDRIEKLSGIKPRDIEWYGYNVNAYWGMVHGFTTRDMFNFPEEPDPESIFVSPCWKEIDGEWCLDDERYILLEFKGLQFSARDNYTKVGVPIYDYHQLSVPLTLDEVVSPEIY